MDIVREYIIDLRSKMTAVLDKEKLRLIVFDVGLDWDELPGETKTNITNSVLILLAQQGRLSDLIEILRIEHPFEQWDDAPPSEQQKSFGKNVKLVPYAALHAMSENLSRVDEIGDEWANFATGESSSYPPKEYRRIIQAEGDALVSRQYGDEMERITADEFATKLSPEDLEHIYVLEESLQNHYRLWKKYYPQRINLSDAAQEQDLNTRLNKLAQGIAEDLKAVLGFLELLGLVLDDHYLRYRWVAGNFSARSS